MPKNAIRHVAVDSVLPADKIADKLAEIVGQRNADHPASPDTPGILIVEDEALLARNMREKLSYRVCGSVTSGEEAITAAAEKQPQLIVTDTQLAGEMNGIDCLC